MNLNFVFLFFAFSLCNLRSTQSERIFEIDGITYMFSVPLKRAWHGAYQYCRYRGMSLIDITSHLEQQKIENLINSLESPYKESYYWTSGTDLYKEGEFIWMSTGHPFVYTNWNVIERNPSNSPRPEYGGDEDCVELRVRLEWNDHSCAHENYFICKNETSTKNCNNIKNKNSDFGNDCSCNINSPP